MASNGIFHGRGWFISLILSISDSVGFVLPFGQFAMIFPAKWFYISMVVLFEIGSALCGAAPNIDALIIGRVIAGVGAVGIYTGALFLISVNTTEEERYPQYDAPADEDHNI